MGFESLLRGQWSQGASGRMTALPVREHCNVCNHSGLGLFVRRKLLQINPCGFSGAKEALGHGVIPPVPSTAHTRLNAMLREAVPLPVGAILTALVGMHTQPRCRVPLAERHG